MNRLVLPAAALVLLLVFGQAATPNVQAESKPAAASTKSPAEARAFLTSQCRDCHSADYAEGGFSVDELLAAKSGDDLQRWVRVWDRVAEGEMPPSEDEGGHVIDAATVDAFLASTGDWVKQTQRADAKQRGRVQERRLTAAQLERTLQNLLGIDIPLAYRLPDDRRTHGYTTVAEGQSVSHFDLQNHLDVVDEAVDEAFGRLLMSGKQAESDIWTKPLPPAKLAYRPKGRRGRMPELYTDKRLDGEKAVVWSVRLPFFGQMPPTQAKKAGWYRITFEASAINAPEFGVWCVVRAGRCQSSEPIMTDILTFQATEERKTIVAEAWLPETHMFLARPADSRLKMGTTARGQAGVGEIGPQNVPGLVIHDLTLEKFHPGASHEELRKSLVAPFDVVWNKQAKSHILTSKNPKRDIGEFLRRFSARAFRRPCDPQTLLPYLKASHAQLDAGASSTEVVRDAMRAVLCSPRFLYHVEPPGELDDYALAARLSYFLTGTLPDPQLWAAAEDGTLHRADVLRRHTDRILNAGGTAADVGGAARFARLLGEEWLDLSEIDFTEPDRKLHQYYDVTVQNSLLAETRTFLTRMVDENWPAASVVDGTRLHLNERLATHYGFHPERFEQKDPMKKVSYNRSKFDPAKTDAQPLTTLSPALARASFDRAELREVTIPDDHPRGGLLTQGAILKVTANGTNTSPVVRGVWVCERILGMHVPPPPSNVPAVEPDTRGATTIREQLARHQSDPSCASCHRKIDPAGYALEAFDPAGRFRTHYPVRRRGKVIDGPLIDGSNTLPAALGIEQPDFGDVVELQQILAASPKPLARNIAQQMLTYGTGAPVGFADREEVDRIVQQAASDDYGVRSILHAVVQSSLFREK